MGLYFRMIKKLTQAPEDNHGLRLPRATVWEDEGTQLAANSFLSLFPFSFVSLLTTESSSHPVSLHLFLSIQVFSAL